MKHIKIIVSVLCILILIIIYIIFACKTDERYEGITMNTINNIEVYSMYSGKSGPCIGLLGGVHGNEPAGTVFIEHLVNTKYIPSEGSIIAIPRANPFGLQNKKRYQNNHILTKDINRNFEKGGGIDMTSQAIITAFEHCDIVIDFHEGWGYHISNHNSIGSSLEPSGSLSKKIAINTVKLLNNDIHNPAKKFVIRNNASCGIPNTLGCYMKEHGREYILVETTGQNNVQPLYLRVNQAYTIFNNVCKMIYSH